MKQIKLNKANISQIVLELQNDKTIIYPTETCYGLGCDATNQQAVDKIFDIKKRDRSKSLLVIVPSMEMLLEYVEWTPMLQKIANKYWPGPLTCVMNLKPGTAIADGVKAQDATLAFRISSHPFSAEVSQQLGVPIVSTSANISMQPSPYDIESIQKMFVDQDAQPDLFIMSGSLPEQTPSTIIKIQKEKAVILRQGEIIIDKDFLV